LFAGDQLSRCSALLIDDIDGHGLAVRTDGYTVYGDTSTVPFGGFFDCVVAYVLHRNAGGARVALVRSITSVQFGTAGLTDWGSHIQHVGINLKRDAHRVV
jgi:hypothetical protein